VQYLRENINNDPNKWHWGSLNKIVYPHAMSMQKPLDKVFNVGPLPMAGNKHTVCQIGSPIGTYAEKAWAPSYRQIVNMADLSKSYVVFPPGQSGNLASPHYRDLFELWYKGQYIPMLWTPDQIEANLEGKLELAPN
jgi:penicillin amidase